MTDLRRRSYGCQVLAQQTRLFTARADFLDLKRRERSQAKGQRRSQYLATAFVV